MTDGTSLSVVVVCRDQDMLLADTVASVRTHCPGPADIVVVDDGSIDQTAAVAARLRVRCFHQAPRGRRAALAVGLDLARGDLVLFLTAGDQLLGPGLARSLALLAGHPQAAFAAGPLQPAGLSAILFRRAALRSAGGLPADLEGPHEQAAAAALCIGRPRLHHDAAVVLPGPGPVIGEPAGMRLWDEPSPAATWQPLS
jgi:glycosyltransferase involved in cell wall biosynthesis